jgi:organic radical activating enzyme
MIKLFPVVEFYITNVCNLSCRGCNRFNDLNFKGHQYWDDYADEYEAWSKRLELPRITIIGGEPTLNPDLEKWCANLRRLWPNAVIMIQTNGTYQKFDPLEYWRKYSVGIGLSLHDPATADELKEKWKNLAGPFEAYIFHQNTVIKEDDHWVLHQSNPKRAFDVCDMKHDHTMYNGKLYKCPAMSGLPDFDQQFDLRMDDRQRKLLYSFKPLTADCSEEELQQFVATKDQHIPQCEFCPENLKWHTALGEYREMSKPIFEIKEIKEDDLNQARHSPEWLTTNNK